MLSIDGIYEDLYVINKSKFYAFAYPVTSEMQVKYYLNILRDKFADATHICYAYSLSSPRLEKADDNGEPSGTAGKPILELIKKKNMDNVFVAVVRYFGGIKLGAGGLVRAYTTSANLVLDKAKIIEMIEVETFRVEVDVQNGARLMDSIRAFGGEIICCVYEDRAIVEFRGHIIDKIKSIYPNAKVERIGSEMICQK